MKQVEVMYVVAQHQPATAKEVNNVLAPDGDVKQASGILTKLYRDGLLIRREVENGKTGGNPYEYALKPLDE
jgi:predicted transcriptional regulator